MIGGSVHCPNYQDGCECNVCSDLEVWGAAQGQMPNPYRAAAKAKKPNPSPAWMRGLGPFTLSASPGFAREFADFGKVTHTIIPPTNPKLPAMNCIHCKHRNEFVGPEHLVNGEYVCRQCRPRLGLKVVGT